MFGLKEASEDKLKKMVEKGKWDKLRKQYLDSDKTTQVALAKACAASRNDGSVNILTSLLEVDDVDVKIAAVTSLGEVGDDHVTALIRQLAVKTPADQTELKAAITKALEKGNHISPDSGFLLKGKGAQRHAVATSPNSP